MAIPAETTYSKIREVARPGWPAAFVLLAFVSFAVFTAIPGTVEGKSLAVLHGLCAQQSTHSYYFGDARLPFDARMTGIYGGFLMTAGYLAARGRWQCTGFENVKVIVALVLLVLPLAIDGTNSFLKDLELFHLYEPLNVVRTATGIMLGTTMATFVWLLVGQTGFQPGATSSRQVWSGLPELGAALAAQFVAATLIGISDLPVRVPLTYLLMASAATMVMGLLLPFVLLVTRSEQQALSTIDLARPATFALIGALLFIGAMAGGRFFLEALLGLPSEVGEAALILR
ncbi:MAG: DUF2085 domain-containing protein [Thermomicrobiales bacterium]